MKHLIIGDIHGTSRELMALLDSAGLGDEDRIIALGDILDRGPDSVGVSRFFLQNPAATSIMGNHEHKHILAFDGKIQPALSQKLAQQQFDAAGYATLIRALRRFPFYLELPWALLVHGAFEPGVALDEQKTSVLLGTTRGEAYLKKSCTRPWYEAYDLDMPLIAGHHDYSRKGKVTVIRDRVFLIDTGCCYGHALSAVLLPDFKILSVQSRRNYWGVLKQQAMQAQTTRYHK